MAFCSKCGFQASDDDSFCARCGSELKYISSDDSKAHKADWKEKEKEEGFWKIFRKSLRHAFFDNEEKMSKKRKAVNIIVMVLILVVGGSIFWPYIADNINITFGKINNVNPDGSCKYRLNAKNIEISDIKFFSDNNKMNFLITNNKKGDLVVERIAKTYEFKEDNRGDTEIQAVNQRIPSNAILNLSFFVREEPHIIGLEFGDCEKDKISSWVII